MLQNVHQFPELGSQVALNETSEVCHGTQDSKCTVTTDRPELSEGAKLWSVSSDIEYSVLLMTEVIEY